MTDDNHTNRDLAALAAAGLRFEAGKLDVGPAVQQEVGTVIDDLFNGKLTGDPAGALADAVARFPAVLTELAQSAGIPITPQLTQLVVEALLASITQASLTTTGNVFIDDQRTSG